MGHADKVFDLATNKKAPSNQAWSDSPELWLQMGMPTTTARTATSAPVEAAISLIAGDLASLEPKLVQENEDGTYTTIKNSPISRVLRKPNEYQTRTDLIQLIVRDTLLYGNAYAWADLDSRGQIRAIYPLRPRQTTPYIASDGSVYYSIAVTELEVGERVNQNMQDRVMVPASQIFHHRIFTANHPLIGISPLYAIGGTATMHAAISNNLAAFHENNARPGGLLIAKGGLRPESRDRLRQDFAKTFSGANTGRVAVLDFDADFQSLPYMKANEQQAVELLRLSVEDVARALHIPLDMLLNQASTTTSVEASQRHYYSRCLRVWIEGLEDRFDDFFGLLGTDKEIEFDLDDLFRAESLNRIERLSKAVQGGIMTPNEARKTEWLAPVEGGDGAFMQRQMTPVAMLSELAAAELTAAKTQSSPAPDPETASPPAGGDQERSIDLEALVSQMRLKVRTRSLTPEVRKETKKASAQDLAAQIRKELAK